MKRHAVQHLQGAGRCSAAALLLMMASGCAGLLPKPPPQPVFYALDSAKAVPPAAAVTAAQSAPSLIIDAPRAAAGYDSARIIYGRTPHRLEYYAQSEWVDTPARLLAPLLVTALENTGAFSAVVLSPGSAAGELRLATELLRLQHDFSSTPSQVHLTLRASLIDNKTRRVLAARQFEQTVAARSEDAYGGVVAANLAVKAALDELAAFTADAGRRWVPAAPAVSAASK